MQSLQNRWYNSLAMLGEKFMHEQPKITVIMPVYNTAEYLPRAFDALLAQSNKAFKLIVVDDGSTDDSVKVAEKYSSRFPYFTLIKKKNGGPSDARNCGLAQVDTPYFTFHDGDDWVDPDFIAYFLNAFKEHPEASMVSCGYWIDSPNKKEKVVGKPQQGILGKIQTYYKLINVFGSPVKGYSWNKAYKTKIMRKYNLHFDVDISLLEDQIFNVKYVAVGKKIYYTQKPYYHYWQRKGSIIHQPNFKKVVDNCRGNYRVWKVIINSLLSEKNELKFNKSERNLKVKKAYERKG